MIQGTSSIFPLNIPNDFRLSLTTAVPVTTSDVINGTTIYCVPYKGNAISLYNGSVWQTYYSNEFSLALGTLTNIIPYDVFCYANAGVPTLEFLAWTNTTTRATALTTLNGILCKTGATTRRYMGSFYNPGNQSATVTMTIAAPGVITYTAHGLSANAPVVFTTNGALPTGIVSGTTYYVASLGMIQANTFNVSATPGGAIITTSGSQSGTHTCTVGTYTEDSKLNRYLFNYNNRTARLMYRNEALGDYTYSTAVRRQANANLANQLNYFCGVSEDLITAEVDVRMSNTTANSTIQVSIGLDSYTSDVNTRDAHCNVGQVAANYEMKLIASYADVISLGKHYLSWIEFTSGGASTWKGNLSCLKAIIVN